MPAQNRVSGISGLLVWFATARYRELVDTADALCAGPGHNWQADLIIRLGHGPIAHSVFEWCGRHSGTVIESVRDLS